MKNYINRPWDSSFGWANALSSNERLEQIHKLCRNYVCSLNMGCPQVHHTPNYPGLTSGMTDREIYKIWVKGWKYNYAELSKLIRKLKLGRKQKAGEQLNSLSRLHLSRMQETAQVMLNGRYNAKLAAAEARRRSMALPSNEEVKQAA